MNSKFSVLSFQFDFKSHSLKVCFLPSIHLPAGPFFYPAKPPLVLFPFLPRIPGRTRACAVRAQLAPERPDPGSSASARLFSVRPRQRLWLPSLRRAPACRPSVSTSRPGFFAPAAARPAFALVSAPATVPGAVLSRLLRVRLPPVPSHPGSPASTHARSSPQLHHLAVPSPVTSPLLRRASARATGPTRLPASPRPMCYHRVPPNSSTPPLGYKEDPCAPCFPTTPPPFAFFFTEQSQALPCPVFGRAAPPPHPHSREPPPQATASP